MAAESRLIPIMREGVDVVKMILFKELKAYLSKKYEDAGQGYVNNLSGAIINNVFGSPNEEGAFRVFGEANKHLIEEETEGFAHNFEKLRILLTDTLRVQFLCDHQEGIDSSPVLVRAKELGILVVDREVPLPAQFISLVKKLGAAFHIVAD